MRPYIHRTYARIINTVDGYYDANMNMLNPVNRGTLFPADRPIRTRNRGGVSTYYGENSTSRNCLVADDCIIYGNLENCIVFPGARIGRGATVKNSILMKGCHIEDDAELNYVISDKNVSISKGLTLTGSPKLPIVIPSDSII
jgi:ADP-glucose pyrophosphorylase